jgi:hypothetical protein
VTTSEEATARMKAALERVRQLRAADRRLRIRRRTGEEMFGVGETTYRGYERDGEVETVVDNGQMWTLTGSIYDKMERDIIKSYADGGMPSAADPRKGLIPKKKTKRPRSQAQLEALRGLNEQRHRDKLRRAEERRVREAEAEASTT